VIISHSKKFCYWKIARTGSNTAELCIRMSNVLDLEEDLVTSCHFFPASHNVELEEMSGHNTPDEAIALGYITPEQYDRYDHYTIVREPLQRWISAYAYKCRMHIDERITPLEYSINAGDDIVTRRQSDYITNDTIVFPFSDYENSIREIITRIGGTLYDVPKIEHKTRGMWRRTAERAIQDTELGDTLRVYYRDDFNL